MDHQFLSLSVEASIGPKVTGALASLQSVDIMTGMCYPCSDDSLNALTYTHAHTYTRAHTHTQIRHQSSGQIYKTLQRAFKKYYCINVYAALSMSGTRGRRACPSSAGPGTLEINNCRESDGEFAFL